MDEKKAPTTSLLDDRQKWALDVLKSLCNNKELVNKAFPNSPQKFFHTLKEEAHKLELNYIDFDTVNCLYIFAKTNGGFYSIFTDDYENIVARFLIFLKVNRPDLTFYFMREFDEYIRQVYFPIDQREKLPNFNLQENTRSKWTKRIKNTLKIQFQDQFLNRLQRDVGSNTRILPDSEVSTNNTSTIQDMDAFLTLMSDQFDRDISTTVKYEKVNKFNHKLGLLNIENDRREMELHQKKQRTNNGAPSRAKKVLTTFFAQTHSESSCSSNIRKRVNDSNQSSVLKRIKESTQASSSTSSEARTSSSSAEESENEEKREIDTFEEGKDAKSTEPFSTVTSASSIGLSHITSSLNIPVFGYAEYGNFANKTEQERRRQLQALRNVHKAIQEREKGNNKEFFLEEVHENEMSKKNTENECGTESGKDEIEKFPF